MGCAHQRVSSQDRRRGRLYRRWRCLPSDSGDHVQSDGRPGNRSSGPSGAAVIRALYMAKTAVAVKHRRATDATNMSDERPYVREQSLTDGCANGGWRLFSPGRLLFRWLRSAAFTTSGGVDGHAVGSALERGLAPETGRAEDAPCGGIVAPVAGRITRRWRNRSRQPQNADAAGIKPGPLTL